jgi:hypothetical protein
MEEMPTRVLTPGAALRELAKLEAVPAEGVLNPRRGTCDRHERGLRFRLLLHKDRSGRMPSGLGRQLFVSVSGLLGDPQEKGGLDATIGIRADRPLAGSGDDVGELATFVESARQFVADPSDLCWLLSRDSDVWRGDLYAWLYQGYAARLVKALAVARDLGDADHARQVLDVLHSGHLVAVTPVEQEDILVVARRRAAELEHATGIAIEI